MPIEKNVVPIQEELGWILAALLLWYNHLYWRVSTILYGYIYMIAIILGFWIHGDFTIHNDLPLVASFFFDGWPSRYLQEKGQPLPKFGEWDVNNPASAEGFTVIFNKARNEKKMGGKPESPAKDFTQLKRGAVLGKPQSVSFFLIMLIP